MKLSKIYSQISCLVGRHDWQYSSTTDHKKIVYSGLEPHEFSRICSKCFKKQKRKIFDLGRNMIWIDTSEYSISELRKINLNKLLED
jgi:hypothetical protein